MMRTLSCLAGLSVLFGFSVAGRAAEPNALTPEQKEAGWVLLFDGRSLAGWKPTSDADWKVADGEIRVTKGAQGWLMTDRQYGDFELHVEFNAPPATNSGVFFRTPLAPTDPAKDCYELNIAPADNPFPTGSLVARRKWPSDADDEWKTHLTVDEIEELKDELPMGEDEGWESFTIRARGGQIAISLSGPQLYIYKDPHPLGRGRIGLQFREGPVAFRNIRLREIAETNNHEGRKE